MKAFLISMLAVVALAVAADQGARLVAQNRLASQVQSRLELEERPRVQLSAFPFVPRVIGGEIPRMTISSDALSRQRITLRDVSVTLRNVTFELGEVLGGDPDLHVTGGAGEASMTEADLQSAIEAEVPVEITFSDDAVLVYSPDLDQEATLSFELRDGDLELVSDLPIELPSVRLPALFVTNARYEGVDIDTGRATLRLSVEPGTFNLSR